MISKYLKSECTDSVMAKEFERSCQEDWKNIPVEIQVYSHRREHVLRVDFGGKNSYTVDIGNKDGSSQIADKLQALADDIRARNSDYAKHQADKRSRKF